MKVLLSTNNAKRIGICLVISTLLSCASTTLTQAPNTTPQSWQIQGRMAVLDGSDSWPASVNWQQLGSDYQIELIGPLGQGRISIRGDAEQVEMLTEKERFSAADPDTLLVQTTGLNIPISGLQHWIRGMIDPNSEARVVHRTDGKIAQIEQNGWRIDYLNWIQQQGVDVPKRIEAEQPPYTVKIVIANWTLASES